MSLRVCLVDDDDSIRADVSRMLTVERWDLALATFRAPSGLLSAIDRGDDFDVALIDLGLPEMPGEALIRQVKQRRAGLPVVAFTIRDDDEAIFSALRAGAVGYMTKHTPVAELVQGVRAAAQGAAPLSPSVGRRVVSHFWREPSPPAGALANLTRRERDVFDLLCTAASYKEVATRLGISSGTVQTHVKSIYAKLGVTSKAEAVLIRVGGEVQLAWTEPFRGEIRNPSEGSEVEVDACRPGADSDG